jgi:hypothetical protein
MRENGNFDGRTKLNTKEMVETDAALKSIFFNVDMDFYLVRPYLSAADNTLRIKIIAGKRVVYDANMSHYLEQRLAANLPVGDEKIAEYEELAKKAPKKWG